MTVSFAILGANGRMGKELTKLYIEKYQDTFNLVARIDAIDDHSFQEFPFFSNIRQAPDFDLLIDFSTPAASINALPELLRRRAAWFLATTGLDEVCTEAVRQAATQIPVLHAANTSLGIALMQKLCAIAAETLQSWDCEILETHHHHKKDAPSGTALAIAKTIAAARDIPSRFVMHRDDLHEPRNEADISIASLRGGTVAGEHSVIWFGPFERLEIKHTAENRQIFAQGTYPAAEWLTRQPAGYYSMRDFIG